MSNPPNVLDYAKRPRSRKRWRAWLLVAVLVIGAALIVFYKAYAPSLAATRSRLAQIQKDRAMMSYEAPAGHVVWDDTANPPIVGPASSAFPIPRGATQLFMHGLRTSSAQESIVVIERVPPRSGHGEHLSVTLYEPATLTKWTRHHGPGVAFESQPIVGGPAKTIYAGRADPKDQSHFTIDYDIAGVRHTLDGWLVDVPRDESGATVAVKMSDRVGPTTASPTDTK